MPSPTAHLRHWPPGVPHTLRVPQVALTHFVQVNAERYPDKPAFIFGGATLTHGQLWQRVQAFAGYVQQRLGVRAGERVLLLSQNCPQVPVVIYGTQLAGAAVVPVSPMSTVAELAHYLRDSGARVAVVAQELLPTAMACHTQGLLDAVIVLAYSDALVPAPADGSSPTVLAPSTIDPIDLQALPAVVTAPRERLPHAVCHGLEESLALRLPKIGDHPHIDQLALLPYTSGTTGRPKGCRHSHATLLASAIASQVWRSVHVDAVLLGVAPLFHMLGMQNALNQPTTLGATVVLMPRWNPREALRLMQRHRVTAWGAPPAMIMDLFALPEAASADLSSLCLLAGGGATMPNAIARMLHERFGLTYGEAYGLTETASFLHANPLHRAKRQCLGVPTQGVDSRIIDPETLHEQPRGEVGEIVTHGAQVMLGYWNNPAADADAFIHIDGKRFFRTGDLGMVDEDGYFHLRDRLKRMVNSNGLKIWPAEVEALLYEHADVAEACVIGVPDAQRGESVRALIVPKPGQAMSPALQPEALDAWCRERMAAYKVPRGFELRVTLPRSATGKIAWRELQEAEASRRQAAPVTPAEAG